ncbi:MAG TPA: PBP1A family penicillin-binding protein [Nitrospinota bacterium]|nr:PBP1A family penicillin-binding protein [Nitrospinota bacterium]
MFFKKRKKVYAFWISETPRIRKRKVLCLYIPLSISGILSIFLITAFLFYFIFKIPSIEDFQSYKLPLASKVYSDDGELIGEFFLEKRIFVPLSKVPRHFKEAIISVEDTRFYSHRGIDLLGILRAFYSNIKAGEVVEGGSTITQQLVRSLFFNREKKLSRKIKEILLAIKLERKISKDKILELYLNQIYFGHGAYGIEAASQAYFGKSVDEIDLQESALLAGLPQAPSAYSPFINPKKAFKRRNHVLKRMMMEKKISSSDFKITEKSPLGLNVRNERKVGNYFIEYVRQQLEEKYKNSLLYKGGLHIYTTLNKEMQENAEDALREGLLKLDKRQRMLNIVNGDNSVPEAEGSLLACEPKTGYIKALVGGFDFNRSKFNRAIQAKRQPGSAFKPILYLAALDNGFTPADIIIDSPIVHVNLDTQRNWKPNNYNRMFSGKTTLRNALAFSRNVISVKLLERVGIDRVIEYAKILGIKSPLTRNLSLALGTSEVSLLELTSSFGVFASGGFKAEPIPIKYILDRDGKILDVFEIKKKRVISEETAYLMTSMLEEVVKNGTGRNARSIKRPIAGKTGTTDNFMDSWFIGFTPNLVAGVWVGFDEPRSLGPQETGSKTALPIFVKFMKKSLKDVPIQNFSPPNDVTFVKIDKETGQLATKDCPTKNVIFEVFKKGTEPTRYCDIHSKSKGNFLQTDFIRITDQSLSDSIH